MTTKSAITACGQWTACGRLVRVRYSYDLWESNHRMDGNRFPTELKKNSSITYFSANLNLKREMKCESYTFLSSVIITILTNVQIEYKLTITPLAPLGPGDPCSPLKEK